jgi:SAM-dependent methyltransferase
MHPDSMMLMANFKNKHHEFIRGRKVLDVGSQDINGSYKQMFVEMSCDYTGTDIVTGPNVDVITDLSKLAFDDKSFDIVISGQTLEHAAYPWVLAREMGRVMKSGGLACWIAPWQFHVHRDGLCPYDRWRILDDGMKILLQEAGLETLECFMHGNDTVGIGRKP